MTKTKDQDPGEVESGVPRSVCPVKMGKLRVNRHGHNLTFGGLEINVAKK